MILLSKSEEIMPSLIPYEKIIALISYFYNDTLF
jgi:hypothetical protein